MPRDPTVPRHVAVVMDGNGRWARKRYMPRVYGHKQGVDALVRAVNAFADRGVDYLTVFAFSSENWKRPSEEVSGLMGLVLVAVSKYLTKLAGDGVRVRIVGDRSKVSNKLREAWEYAERSTAHNTRINLSVAFNYGGRWDMVQACRHAMADGVHPEALDEAALSRYMALSFAPDPDLFIRTGGEMRISNFLLWQSAYSEFVFTERLWPDFDETDIDAGATGAFRPKNWCPKASEPMLWQRIVTAVVLLALLVPALFAPLDWPFNLLTLLLIAAAGWEWARLNQVGTPPALGMGLALASACAAALAAGWSLHPPAPVWWLAAAVWVVGGTMALRSGPTLWPQLPRLARLGLGLAALWAAWLAMSHARGIGINFILSVFCLVWVADIAAYFGGRRFGKRKLAPSISPGKSWEGVYSGMVGVFVLTLAWRAMESHFKTDSLSVFGQLLAHLGLLWACLAAWRRWRFWPA